MSETSGNSNPVYEADEDKIEEGQDMQEQHLPDGHSENVTTHPTKALLYGLNDVPPWYLCIILGLQHYLLTIGSLVGVPLLLAPKLCMGNDDVGNIARANVIGTMFVVSGLCTLLQTTFGNRLPIMQGNSFSFLPPTLAILALPHNQCPDPLPQGFMNSTKTLYNDTDGQIVDGDELWQRRMREIQGAVITASLVEILLGLTGAIGFMMRFIGPLTIVPTISLIGLDLFSAASRNAQGQWGIAVGTTVVLIICTQCLSKVNVPFPSFSRSKKCHLSWVPIFKIFPVLFALTFAWLLCFILTITNAIPNDPNNANYLARTDIRSDVIHNSPWFKFPYPGQWGLPKVTISGFVGMIAAVVASMVESIGDYHACARLAEAPPPPVHAINRGIMMEGFGVLLAGTFGTSSGTTSFSQNVAAIGITRVGSRRVLQAAGFIFIVLGLIGKFGSIFVTIPDPVIGGLFFVMFGMIAAVGLSNLQFVDLNSNRNLLIIGVTLLTGLSVANWMKANPGIIQTGVVELDQILTVLLSSAILVGGSLGMLLDNTLPGTIEERGLEAWKKDMATGDYQGTSEEYSRNCYDLPFPTSCCRFSRFLPILPEFENRLKKEF